MPTARRESQGLRRVANNTERALSVLRGIKQEDEAAKGSRAEPYPRIALSCRLVIVGLCEMVVGERLWGVGRDCRGTRRGTRRGAVPVQALAFRWWGISELAPRCLIVEIYSVLMRHRELA